MITTLVILAVYNTVCLFNIIDRIRVLEDEAKR
jgi:hypothetical protein